MFTGVNRQLRGNSTSISDGYHEQRLMALAFRGVKMNTVPSVALSLSAPVKSVATALDSEDDENAGQAMRLPKVKATRHATL